MSEMVTGWLRAIASGLDNLPELQARWPDLPQDERDEQDLEWEQLMSYFDWLGEQSSAGAMTAEERAAYRALRDRVKRSLPLIDAMGLVRPTVSLDPSPAASTT